MATTGAQGGAAARPAGPQPGGPVPDGAQLREPLGGPVPGGTQADGARSDGPGVEPGRAEALLTAPGAPFAVVRGESGALEYATGPRTLREFVETVWAFGERPFLVAESGGYSYGEFLAASCALARHLVDVHGLRPGDRAAIAMRNHPEWQVAFWSAQLAGLVAVPLNAWWTAEEFTYALDDCTPRVLLVDGERLERVAGWARAHGVRGMVFHHEGDLPEGFERFADLDELTSPDPAAGPPDVDVVPDADATIIYTSGTTGRPKGAVATQLAQAGAAMNPRFQAAASMLGRGIVPGQGPAPVTLMTFPFFHVAAFTSVYAAMGAGGTLVLMHKWDAGRALALIREHGVTHYAGVPSTALQLLDAAEQSGDGLESLTALNTGGAAAPPGLVGGLTARHGSRIEPRNGYGLTETSGGVLANYGAEYRSWPGSAGRPTPVTEVRIAGPDGAPLADGEVGELWLRGQSLVRGYWNDPAGTQLAFQDGWFRTGDLAVRDGAGRVGIVDRIKDMVIRGGENVYCVEVEGVLHDHPAVLDAAVLGVPHPVLGEEVAAVVQVRAGAAVSPEELRDHVRAVLAGFKVPGQVVVREAALPRNATGKVLKRELRDVFPPARP
ncbi:class I adenylate-forming enzyme family protein [Streptomyces xanthochromogenes]|uniref:Fatty acid--CoA ligase n=1 Tax=Streptomyces xanthochromogenes TaxID=67384 RepID=A0ABQ3A1W2_9ACTN|nr:fatty acid--CoA ligase [Streptomyces xanthochromogenes]